MNLPKPGRYYVWQGEPYLFIDLTREPPIMVQLRKPPPQVGSFWVPIEACESKFTLLVRGRWRGELVGVAGEDDTGAYITTDDKKIRAKFPSDNWGTFYGDPRDGYWLRVDSSTITEVTTHRIHVRVVNPADYL